MRANTVDLDLVIGDDLIVPMSFQSESGAAVPVDSCTFAGQVRLTTEAATTLASFAFDMTSAADGDVTASVADTITALFPRDVRYVYYDIERVDAAGLRLTVLRGRINLIPDVTRV